MTPLKIVASRSIHPSCILPSRGGSEPSPSTGEGWIGVNAYLTKVKTGCDIDCFSFPTVDHRVMNHFCSRFRGCPGADPGVQSFGQPSGWIIGLLHNDRIVEILPFVPSIDCGRVLSEVATDSYHRKAIGMLVFAKSPIFSTPH